MKIYIICLALCSLTQAVYISRMSSVNRLRSPTPFRPGASLQRHWPQTRIIQAASHRAPYVLYRKPPQRYAVKHFAPSPTRNMFAGGPWKTTGRLPMSPVTTVYEFVKAASSAPVVHTDGAIHTIPAPNLSLSEKPIVVIEASDNPVSDAPRPSYEVTEKYPESEYSIKIESPIGFSKASSFTTPELQTLIRNGAALQLASEYNLPAIMNQHQGLQQPALQHQVVQHQYPLQALQSALPNQQDLINTGADGLFIPPHALYQNDPLFLQKLQNQLLQRFPSVEFIPYAAEAPNQVHPQPEASQMHAQVIHPQMMQPQVVHAQVIQPQEIHHQMILLENEQLDNPLPPQQNHNEPKTVVQRETKENTIVTLVPRPFVVANTTEKQVEDTPTPQPENITVELVATETEPTTTTVKYIVESNTEQNTTPIYYAQIGQSVGSVIANGFYSAINDVRAAAALAQVDNSPVYKPENVTTTTSASDMKAYFAQNEEKSENTTATELKSLRGVPFTKPRDSVNVAYTLVRADDKQAKVNQEGAVYAGQIVEATITEDQDFNKEKATLISRRAPIRLFAVADTKNIVDTANTLPQVAVVKAKIPPKSKLTFDDRTGEPILRIYASYVDSPKQKAAIVSKLSSLKPVKDAPTKKDAVDNWKAATIKAADKTQGVDANQVTQFGLKLKEKNDFYSELIFEDYEDL
ncbi:hypothetical protein PYW08_001803 [Mythimna loreyi]|uniref:Uncharacterized protein n=1 Tax=Mythimna loreyi TaxID=667449 RepID=A0ACC2R526_9NEOP|nr:hypothetical protein PYW08_001803 [Mythimna loreyi]